MQFEGSIQQFIERQYSNNGGCESFSEFESNLSSAVARVVKDTTSAAHGELEP